MSYQADLISEMAQRMEIAQGYAESHNDYKVRVIYSAIGEWIKAAVYDTILLPDDSSEEDLANASKHHITRKVTSILETILTLYPEIKEYFVYDKVTTKDCITELRARLIDTGMLVSATTNSLQYPDLKAAKVAPDYYLCRGEADCPPTVIGLGTYYEDADPEILVSIEEMFQLTHESAEEFLDRYLSVIESNFRDEESFPEGREYFNCYLSTAMYKSWSLKYPEKQSITIYRDNHDMYGLIRKTETGFQTSAIPSAFVELQDIRRLIFGLWAKEKRSPTVSIEKRKDLCYLHLPSHLPRNEQGLLYLTGWPRNTCTDKTQYIIPTALVPFVEKLLKSLNLEIRYK